MREAEVESLLDSDAPITARTGLVRVHGNAARPAKYATGPHPDPDQPMAISPEEDQGIHAIPELFVALGGRRLSARSIDHVIRGTGREAGLELSPRIARHTYATNLVRAGTDLVMVAELLGHSRVETVRIYTTAERRRHAGHRRRHHCRLLTS